MTQLLQQMQKMQQQISGLTLTNQQLSQFGGKINSTNQGGNKNVNPRTSLPWKRYCRSCGCCTHWSNNYLQKKSGHKDDASFKTRMGETNENCK